MTYVASTHILDINNFNEVKEVCQPFSAKWEDIGCSLGIMRNTVESIREDYDTSIKRLSELIAVWLRRESDKQLLPSWRVLCVAIASVDRTSAERIASEHQCDCIQCKGESKSSKMEAPDMETRIWTAGEAGAEVVEACVQKLQDAELFPDDKKLMRRIAFIMSRDGNPPIQLRNDGGIWQVSHFAFDDTKDPAHIRLPKKYQNLQNVLKIKHWSNVTRTDLEIPMYSAIAARLYLSNYSESIPPSYDIKRQTKYWWNLYMKNHEALPIMSEQDFVNSVRILEK